MNMKKWVMLLLFLLVIPSVSAQVWYSTSVNYLGALNFASIYDSYALYFDAVIYLFIFLGLGMSVFGVVAQNEPEKEKAYKLIYIGLALLLTISLLLLESRMGFTLLEKLGSFTAFILLVILIFSAYKIFSFFTENKWISIGLTIGSTLVFLDSFYGYFEGFPFLGTLFNDFINSGLHRLLWFFAMLALVAWLVKKFNLKATKLGERTERPEVVTPERETAGGFRVPEEILADLQEKDRTIQELRTNIGNYDAKFQELNQQIEAARATGDAGLSERLVNQSREFEERIESFKQETSDKLIALTEDFEKERNLLRNKIMSLEREQAITLEKLKNEIDEGGKTILRNKLAVLGKQLAGYKKAASATAIEAKKLLWARSEAERIIKSGISLEKYSGLPIMQPKPVPLLPAPEEKAVLAEEFRREEGILTPEELDEALEKATVVDKIDIGLKYINRLLVEIPGPRNALYTERGIRELVYSIFSGRKYRANIVLEDLRDNLERLARAATFYLRTAKPQLNEADYRPYLKRFLDDYNGLHTSFIKIAQYSKLRDRVRSELREINSLSPIVYKKLRQNYAMIYKVGEGVNQVIDNNKMLNDIQRQILHQKVAILEKYGKVFESNLINHFEQLKTIQNTVQAISVAIAKLRSKTHKYKVD